MPTFFVTGCTRGIGLEFARQLSARGDEVLATARDPERAGELSSLPVQIVGLDVSDRWSIENLADPAAERAIDVLINNAGVSSASKTLAECDFDELGRVFTINSIGPVMVSKALVPSLRLGKRRVIVNISSQLGSISNNTGGSSYGYRASKAALNMFTTCLANEFKGEGFTCVSLHPGWVRTDMGGAEAPLTPQQSVRQMLTIIDRLTPAESGKFLSYDGKIIPW
jgi:NAD(P)-dependent dehydrogenase (short-subunit alcohol dehydrogenase family)